LFHTMYQALIAACSCKTTFRHAKAVTVLIVGTAFHSLSLGSGPSWMPAASWSPMPM